MWDVERGYCTHVFRGHTGVVTCAAFHPQRAKLTLFTGGADAEVRAWSLATRECLGSFTGHFSAVSALAVSACGAFLLSVRHIARRLADGDKIPAG